MSATQDTSKGNFLSAIKVGGPFIGAFAASHIPQVENFCIEKIGSEPFVTFYVILFFLLVIWALVTVIYAKTRSIKKSQEKLLTLQKELAESIKPVVSDNSVNALKSCVVHHRTLKTWDKIREAKKEIILHAAYYPKYGYDSDYSNAFRVLMRNRHCVNVTVVITDITAQWAEEFGRILRYEYDTIDRFREGIESSIAFFKKLKEEFPNRVNIITSSRLPLMPFVIVDDDILVGHYCHAETPAPNGLWLHLNSEKISDIIDKVRHENAENRKAYILNLSDEEKAISRYIEDVFDAIRKGQMVE